MRGNGGDPAAAAARIQGPVLAVSGWSGSGKTTLLEAVIPGLIARGLKVAVVKRDVHGLHVDQPGKDSDRLYRAGAHVWVAGPDETVRRGHGTADLRPMLDSLWSDHDLVLLEGHKTAPVARVWLAGADGAGPPPDARDVLAVLPPGDDRVPCFQAILDAWLPAAWRSVPVAAGLLVGGHGGRMGTPKQLLTLDGFSFAERVLRAVSPAVSRVVALGDGPLPEACAGLPRVSDVGSIAGPLAGMLAALRWEPRSAWLFVACDLPRLTTETVHWLLDQRAPGRWAVFPGTEGLLEPLCALYEPPARGLLEALVAAGGSAPRHIADHPQVRTTAIPTALAGSFANVNTPEELARLRARR